MKKIISMLLSVIIMAASFNIVLANDTRNASLPVQEYNNKYTEKKSEKMFSLDKYNQVYMEKSDSGLLTLDEYNKIYSNQNIANISIPKSSLRSPLSGVKRQTKNIVVRYEGSVVGTVTLEYQTWIQGGRTQFAYDTCKVGHSLSTYWFLEESYTDFTGDRIGVYFSFVFGSMQDYAWVYFYP